MTEPATGALPTAAMTAPIGGGLPFGTGRPRWVRALDQLAITRDVLREVLHAYAQQLGPTPAPEDVERIQTWRRRGGIP